MKGLTIAALIAGQALAGAQPAQAAELTENRTQQMGAFAGLRLRMPLDSEARQRRLRAGLTLAPTMHSRSASGESRMRMGEGLELGLAGDEPVRLSLGGTPVSRLVQGPAGPDGRRAGVSTVGWIAIGVGTVVLLYGGLLFLIAENSDCDPGEC